MVVRPSEDDPILPVPKQPAVIKLAEVERAAFFDQSVSPEIARADRSNREAAQRCVERVTAVLNGYKTGIAPFCDEINGWGTRLGVIQRMPPDWWYQQASVADYVSKKFEKHLFSDAKLRQDLNHAIAIFRSEIDANQNAMFLSIKAATASVSTIELPDLDYSNFESDLSATLTTFATRSAERSVLQGLLTELASGLGGIAAEQLVVAIATRIAAMAAASAAGAGGATAGGAAVGGGGGSLAGPIGTAAGLAAGLAVGVVIDWWMSSKFKAKMSERLSSVIDELKSNVLGTNSTSGLQSALPQACDSMLDAYRQSLYNRLVIGNSL